MQTLCFQDYGNTRVKRFYSYSFGGSQASVDYFLDDIGANHVEIAYNPAMELVEAYVATNDYVILRELHNKLTFLGAGSVSFMEMGRGYGQAVASLTRVRTAAKKGRYIVQGEIDQTLANQIGASQKLMTHEEWDMKTVTGMQESLKTAESELAEIKASSNTTKTDVGTIKTGVETTIAGLQKSIADQQQLIDAMNIRTIELDKKLRDKDFVINGKVKGLYVANGQLADVRAKNEQLHTKNQELSNTINQLNQQIVTNFFSQPHSDMHKMITEMYEQSKRRRDA